MRFVRFMTFFETKSFFEKLWQKIFEVSNFQFLPVCLGGSDNSLWVVFTKFLTKILRSLCYKHHQLFVPILFRIIFIWSSSKIFIEEWYHNCLSTLLPFPESRNFVEQYFFHFEFENGNSLIAFFRRWWQVQRTIRNCIKIYLSSAFSLSSFVAKSEYLSVGFHELPLI